MRRYRCDACGKFEPWGEGWVWYGSWKQLEGQGLPRVKPIEVYCSEECAHRANPTRPVEIIECA